MKLVYTDSAFRQLQKLNYSIQKRIDEKLSFYVSQPEPLNFAEPLINSELGNWRFRVGDHRILFDIEKDKIYILKIGHRKDIYN